MAKKLTHKRQKFVDLFDGNATETARRAGFTGDDATLAQTGYRLLRNAEIKAALEKRNAKTSGPLIASREDRQRFWTSVMSDKAEQPLVRLRASELLGRSEADFVERHEHSGNVSMLVFDPYAKPPEGE